MNPLFVHLPTSRSLWPALLVALVATAAVPAQVVPTITSAFANGTTDGWTASGSLVTVGNASGGNPGGCLFADNNESTSACYLRAPAAYLGDMRSYYGGTLSFDGLLAAGSIGSQSNAQYDYGVVFLVDQQGYRISADAAPGVPTTLQWSTFTLQLTPAAFGVSQAVLDHYLLNCSSVLIGLEALSGPEAHYIDNIVLAPSAQPAAAQPAGGGCPSSGGSNTLIAQTLPWVGSTCQTYAFGLPGIALAFAAYGLSPMPAAPLTTVLPPSLHSLAGPGCALHTTLDSVVYVPASSLTASFAFFVPPSPALAGVTLWHQVVPVQFDGGGNILAVTSTNALRLTVGVR